MTFQLISVDFESQKIWPKWSELMPKQQQQPVRKTNPLRPIPNALFPLQESKGHRTHDKKIQRSEPFWESDASSTGLCHSGTI